MDQSVSPSLLDLYKKTSNPKKTDLKRLNVRETPFVRSRGSSVKSDNPPAPSVVSSDSSRRSSRRSRHSSRKHDEETLPPRQEESTPAFFTQGQQMFAQRNSEMEKTVLLNEYNRLRIGGSTSGRNLTEQDNIADIRWELNRMRNHDDCISTVSVMKDFIKLGATFVDMGNRRLGLLKLNGPGGNWSEECTRDMNRFDRALTKVYTRYIRKGAVSPFIELALLIFGPMLAVHFKNSMAPSVPASTRPASRNVSFQQQPNGPKPSFSPPGRAPMPGPTGMRVPMPGPMAGMRAPMPGPTAGMRAPMPGPMAGMRAPMPGPMAGMRAPMPAPSGISMPSPTPPVPTVQRTAVLIAAAPPIEIDMPAGRQRRGSNPPPTLEIVEEGVSDDDVSSSDHHSIDIHEDGEFDDGVEEEGSGNDSSSVGSFTFN